MGRSDLKKKKLWVRILLGSATHLLGGPRQVCLVEPQLRSGKHTYSLTVCVQGSSHVKSSICHPGHGQALMVPIIIIIIIIPWLGPLGGYGGPRTSCRSLGFMWLTSGLREASVEDVSLSPRLQGHKSMGLRPRAASAKHLHGGGRDRPLSHLVTGDLLHNARAHQ